MEIIKLKISTPKYMHIVIEASDGKIYHSDLSSFSKVHCFPKTFEEWTKVSSDSSGFALIWSSRFEVHIDQVIGLATKIEDSPKTA
jgi:hypothetical protein